MKKRAHSPVASPRPATSARPSAPTNEERALVQALKERVSEKVLKDPKKAATILTQWLRQASSKSNKKAA